MNWEQLCQRPELKDLPFKVELNERGQIIMTPVKGYHAGFQARIAFLLATLLGETTVTECAIQTRKGTKAVDVGWASRERYDTIITSADSPVAPEICVEILSESNTRPEIDEKQQLYFEAGCEEFWTCSKTGEVHFYTRAGEQAQSQFAPSFPKQIDL